MKKLLFASCLLVLPFQIPDMSPVLEDYEKNLPERAETSFITCSDAGCSNKEINFHPGQTVYVKVKKKQRTSGIASLRLLDGNKAEIAKVGMQQLGDGWAGSLITPNISGVYYVNVEIKGEGLSFSGERNIYVRNGLDSQNLGEVKAKAESISDESGWSINKDELQEDGKTGVGTFISWIISLVLRILKLPITDY
jgi:hypothetical protein